MKDAKAEEAQSDVGERGVGECAVVELDTGPVFEGISPAEAVFPEVRGQKGAVHERPRVEDFAGLDPRDRGARKHVQRDQAKRPFGKEIYFAVGRQLRLHKGQRTFDKRCASEAVSARFRRSSSAWKSIAE